MRGPMRRQTGRLGPKRHDAPPSTTGVPREPFRGVFPGQTVSEDRLHQIANSLWVLSSFLTMRGNSAVTRLAQGWMLAGVLALDWSALVWVRRRSGSPA